MSAPLLRPSGHAAFVPKETVPMFSEDRLLNWVGRLVHSVTIVVTGVAGVIFFGPLWVTFPTCLVMTAMYGLLWVLEPSARGWRAERQVRQLLRRHELPAVHDVFLSAPDGRRAQFDHVLFLGRWVAVIETKSITGVVARRGTRWTRLLGGRERSFAGRTPQQQVMEAREVLMAAYPAWNRSVLALTVLTHGTLGEGLEDSDWVVGIGQLAAVLGRFRQVPDEPSKRRWQDLARFLEANKRTRRDRIRFLRREVLHPPNFGREQLFAFGMLFGAAVPLIVGTITFVMEWYLLRASSSTTHALAAAPPN